MRLTTRWEIGFGCDGCVHRVGECLHLQLDDVETDVLLQTSDVLMNLISDTHVGDVTHVGVEERVVTRHTAGL